MKFTTIAAVVLTSASAHAYINVTSSSVTHQYNGSEGYPLATTAFTPSGNTFNTYDGYAGVQLNLGPASGGLTVSTWAGSNLVLPSPYGNPGYSYYTPQGTINFTAVDGNFSITAGAATSSYTSCIYRLTQVSTGLYRQIQIAGLYAGTNSNTGTLPTVMGPGDYTLTMSSSGGYFTQVTGPGATSLRFTITPEPTSLAALSPTLLIRRRTRK